MTDPQDRPDSEAEATAETDGDAVAAAPVEAAPDETQPEPSLEPAAAPAEPAAVEIVAAAERPAPARRQRGQKQAPAAPKPLSPYAIIETGGKQYRVSVGDSLSVERLPAEAGSELTIDRVLLLGGDGATRVGTPTVAGAAVTARVEDHRRGEKIIVFKYKAKKRYRRRLGHRQSLTRLTITGITG